jgi:hypothetical protein
MLLGRLLHLHPLVSIQIQTLCNDDLNDLPYTTVNVKAFSSFIYSFVENN